MFLGLGIACLVGSYFQFLSLENGESFFSPYAAIINSIINFIIAHIYHFLAKKLVVWENHKYIKKAKDSLRLK